VLRSIDHRFVQSLLHRPGRTLGNATDTIPQDGTFFARLEMTTTIADLTNMEDGFVQRFLDIRIAGRYQLRKRLGVGTFGQVYQGMGNLINERTALT
jgi:hypothetical protein